MIAGWDDALLAAVPISRKPKKVTFVYPFYQNPNFLRQQLTIWREYPVQLRQYLKAIIVDDGSPNQKAEDVLVGLALPFPIRLFYIEVDVRFNWLAARNVAMRAAEGWVIATDMDHVIPRDTAEALVWGDHDPATIYRLRRREHTGKKIHPHPNSWFMTKEMFWKFGGYDEALSGYYGTDGDARRRWVKTAPVRTMPNYLLRFEHVGDSSTRKYKRKQPEDRKAQELIAARPKDWTPTVFSFPYREINL